MASKAYVLRGVCANEKFVPTAVKCFLSRYLCSTLNVPAASISGFCWTVPDSGPRPGKEHADVACLIVFTQQERSTTFIQWQNILKEGASAYCYIPEMQNYMEIKAIAPFSAESAPMEIVCEESA